MTSSSLRRWLNARTFPPQAERPLRQRRSAQLWDRCEGRTLLSLAIDNVTMIEPPSGDGHADFTVRLDHPADGQTVKVDFSTQDATALAGTDYQATSGTLTFAPGETTKTISVPIVGGRTAVPHEMFTVNLSGAVNDTVDPSLGVGIGTILPTPWLTVGDAGVVRGTSGTTSAVFDVTLSPSNTDQIVSVDYGTADGTARAGTDYQATSGTLTFAPGETTKTISVPIVGTTAAGPQESFSIALSNPRNAVVSDGQATGTIADNNQAGSLQFGAPSYDADGNSATATIDVTRTGGDASGVTVDYATAGGTAAAGVDYTPTSGTLTFDAGQTTKAISVPLLAAAQPGGDRTIGLTLTNPGGGGSLGAQATATLTVHAPAPASGGSSGSTATPTPPVATPTSTPPPVATPTSTPPPVATPPATTPPVASPPVAPPPAGTPTIGSPTPAGTLTQGASDPGTSTDPGTPQANPGTQDPGGTSTPSPTTGGSTTPDPTTVPVAGHGGTLVVTNNYDSGPGSLRQALLDANAQPGLDTITFDIAAPGVITIAPTTALPTITDPVDIDARTQPGYAGTPIIEIDGAGVSGQVNGLTISGGGSTVQGLAINRFGGSGILLEGGGGNRILSNAIGTDLSGTLPLANSYDGIFIEQSANNRIGGPGAGEGNLLSGNTIDGVLIDGAASTGNVLVNNRIGTDASGENALPNQHDGVLINAPGNTVGSADVAARNVISANAGAGVAITGPAATHNVVAGNLIGTDAQGGRSLGNKLDGVVLDHAPGNTIGGTDAGEGNLISGNHQTGIRITGSTASANRVEGNRIGTDLSGSQAVGNLFDGIFVDGAPGTTIGGAGAFAGNVVSANGGVGVQVYGRTATGNQVAGNLIGTDAQGTRPLGNLHDGVYINGAPGNTVGGTAAGARNLISGNRLVGLQFSGRGASGNVVQGNLIGPDVTGTTRPGLGNAVGLFLGGAGGNTIGGPGPALNVIQGNLNADTSNAGGVAPHSTPRVAPPTVVGVAETRDASRITALTVGFSGPIDPSRAQDIANYRLRLPGKDQRFDAPDATPVAIRSATYDSASSTVTLNLASPLATTGPLQLKVSGKPRRGIADLAGHSLDGLHNGRAGSDFAITLGPSAADGP